MPDILDQLKPALADRYQIARELGRGGMATVYLANDLRHERHVAIKVLHPELAAVLGAERFLAEIRTTANLQHPHILPLFDSGSAGPPDASGGPAFLYYVMPFIDGETLRARLDRERQLPVEDAIRIARESADALAYAHERGVIHRDIKPENILLQRGHALVADFGIALAMQQAGGQRMTQTGLSLGTPQYMSPEQATAEKDISPRSDVYSLACVLYEMLTGAPPHVGGSAQQTIVRIITETPRRVSELRKSVPGNVAAAIAKALEKLPADRFENAKAFSNALAAPTFSFTSAATHQSFASTGVQRAAVRNRGVLVGMSLVAAIALAVAGWSLLRPATRAPSTSLDLNLETTLTSGQDVMISPDGSMLAYTGRTANGYTAIFIRRLHGGPEFRMLPGTEGASYPAFSPDNEQIAFRRSDGTLLRMPVGGGGTTKILATEAGFHLHWGTPDLMVFSGPNASSVVPVNGGAPRQLRRIGDRRLFLLPDGSGVLGRSGSDVAFYDLHTDSISILVHNGQHPVYIPGYLLFDDDQGGLSAVRFDLERHRVNGLPVRVLDRVAYNAAARGYSVSNNGTLVWRIGTAGSGPQAGGASRLVISGFDGRADTLRLPVGRPANPRFSPNGNSIVYASPSENANRTDIYTYNLNTKTNTQITFDGNNAFPVWSPDGARIVYSRSDSNGSGSRLHIKAADNSSADELLEGVPSGATPTAWPRADLILYNAPTATDQGDIMSVSPARGAKPQPYVATPAQERDAVLAPDGKFAAYVASGSSGEFNIWMRDFPKPVGQWKLSTSKGGSPRWSPDGKFLYYLQLEPPREQDTLWRVQVDRTPAIQPRTPVFAAAVDVIGVQQWDLHPDGKRFVIAIASAGGRDSTQSPLRHVVILNWLTDIEAALAKAKK